MTVIVPDTVGDSVGIAVALADAEAHADIVSFAVKVEVALIDNEVVKYAEDEATLVGNDCCVPTIEAAGDRDAIPVLELDARVDGDGDATAVADGATYPSDRTTPSESENMTLPSAASAGELCTDAPVPSE